MSYDRETVRFFDIAHEGAQVRAVISALPLLAGLAGSTPRSVVVLATDYLSAAAARCAVALAGPVRWPVVVAHDLPSFVGPLDVVLVVGDAPEAETATRALAAAAGRGAETVLAGPADGPLVEDAPSATVVLPSLPAAEGASPLRTVAAVTAVLRVLAGEPLDEAVADAVDDELRGLSPERDVAVNLARQLRVFAAGARVIHTGYSAPGAAVAELAATLWSSRGLPSGFVGREDLAAALEDTSTPADDIFHDPYLDGPAVPVKTIVWGEDEARLAGGRAENAPGEELARAMCLIARAYAATALINEP